MRVSKTTEKRGFPFFKKDVEVEKHISDYDTEIYRHMIRYCGVNMPRIIRETAEDAYEEWQKRVRERAVKNTIANYVGNYPPKSLNGL